MMRFLGLALALTAVLCVSQSVDSDLVEYTLAVGDTIEHIAETCMFPNMWKVPSTGRKFVNPYTAQAEKTTVRVSHACKVCLENNPEEPAGWKIYRTNVEGSQSLSEISNIVGADVSKIVLSDLTTKPTENLKCALLYYPEKVRGEARSHRSVTVQETSTLAEMAVEILDDEAAWDQLKADVFGNPIPDATGNTVMQSGEKVWYKIWDHDVIMSQKQHDERFGTPDDKFTTKRAAIIRGGRWPARRVIEYGIANSVNRRERDNIRNAVRDIESRTCVRFRLSSNSNLQRGRIRFRGDDDGCSANVGMMRNGNTVWSDGNCDRNTMIHEIGHALGLEHEQSRWDRDRHIRILWRNIPSSWHDQYEKVRTLDDITPYDYSSLMHYAASYGSVQEMQAIPDSRNTRLIQGTRNGMSRWDIFAFNVLLGFPGGGRCGSGSRARMQCRDESSQCSEWAATGACESNPEEMEEQCCHSCRKLLEPEKLVTCTWTEDPPDARKCHDSCTVLVSNFESYGTCGNYCRSVGKTCTNAWEDVAGTCEAMMSLECEEQWETENSEALCECADSGLVNATLTEPSSAVVAIPMLPLSMILLSALW